MCTAKLTESLREEVVSAMNSHLSDSTEWIEAVIQPKMALIVAKASGPIFVGPECCHDPIYLKASIGFMASAVNASIAIQKIPRILRPIVVPYLPIVKETRAIVDSFADLLEPVIRKRVQEAEELGDDYQRSDDVTQWMLESVNKIGPREIMDIALEQSMLGAAAVSASVQFLNHV